MWLKVILVLSFVCFVFSTDLFLRDCDGNLFAYPKVNGESVAAVNLASYSAMNELAVRQYLDRVKCVCPSASDRDILKVYGTPFLFTATDHWFNLLSRNPQKSIPGCDYQPTVFREQTYGFELPDGCDWENDRECLFKYTWDNDVVLEVAISECPGKFMPFISVSCAGAGCDKAGAPCVSDAECGGDLVCKSIDIYGEQFPGNGNNSRSFISSLFGYGSDQSGCTSTPMDFFSQSANYLRTVMYDLPETSYLNANSIKVCTKDFEFTSLNSSTLLPGCELEYENYLVCVNNDKEVSSASECEIYICNVYTTDPITGDQICAEYSCVAYYYNETTYSYDYDNCIRYQCYSPIYNETTGMITDECRATNEDTRIGHVDCTTSGSLSSWNGVRPDNTNILSWKTSHPFQTPSLTASPRTRGATVLLEMTCDESVKFFPNSRQSTSIQMHKVRDLYNHVYDIFRQRADCEADFYGVPMDDTIFGNNYFLPSYFTLFFKDEETWLDQALPFSTFAQYAFNQSRYSYTKYRMPKSCDYDSWKETGTCEFTYDGLSSLLGIDVKFNFAAKKCDSRQYPSLYIECEGDDCDMMTGLKSCNPGTSSGCSAECFTSREFLVDVLGSSSTDTSTPRDFLSTALKIDTPACPATSLIHWDKYFSSMLSFFEDSPNQGICLPSVTRISSIGNSWSQTQYYIEGDEVVLAFIYPWTAPDPSPEEPIDTEDNSYLFALCVVHALLLALL